MSTIKAIREKLGLTQAELADDLGCSQGSVSFYEKGTTTIPPETAGKLIDAALKRGVKLSFDEIYGRKALAFGRAAASSPSEHASAKRGTDRPSIHRER